MLARLATKCSGSNPQIFGPRPSRNRARHQPREDPNAQRPNRVAPNDRTNAGRSPPHANGDCHGQAETELQTGISPTHCPRRATWPAALGSARACPGRRAAPASGHLNKPARTRRNRLEDDEGRREPEGCGARQSHQPGKAAAVPPRNTETTRSGKVWRIFDLRRFRLPIYSQGQIVEVWLSAEQATKAGQYLSAAGRFLPPGDALVLGPFVGTFENRLASSTLSRPARTFSTGSTPPASCRFPKSTRFKDERRPWRNLNEN